MENRVLAKLEPQNVFRFFEELCRIPHGSYNTKAVSNWAVNFAVERGLQYRQDQLGNVVIFKPATPGYEDHPTVMLQGHLDMVCVKEDGVEHDFMKDPLDLYIDGDWVKARGTSLGGDDGIAIAMAMAVMDDDTIPHPPIEALFTIDEEVGMPGACGFDGAGLKSKYLINIDSELEGVLTVGCAGGARCCISAEYPTEKAEGVICTMSLQNLSGGHSGTAIHRGFGNPNKLLADAMERLGYPRLVEMAGGEQHNAIPTSGKVTFLVKAGDVDAVKAKAQAWADEAKALCKNDPNFTYTWTSEAGSAEAFSDKDSATAAKLIQALPNGLIAMNPDMPDQVQTSLNMGVLRLGKGKLDITFLVRSSSAKDLAALVQKLQDVATEFGAVSATDSSYPPWEYHRESGLRDTMVRVFTEQYGKAPVVETVHAGLECGILMEKIPGMDAVSIGPDLIDIHSTRERLGIGSTQRTFDFLKGVLAAL